MKRRTAVALILAAILLLPSALCAAGLFRAQISPFSAYDTARAAAITASLGGKAQSAETPAQTEGYGERRIVRFRDGTSGEEIESALERSGIEYYPLAGSGSKLFAVYAPEEHAFFTEYSGIIAYSEPDLQRTVLAYTDDPVRLTAYESMGIYEAWDEVTASPDVIIAVLDTGIRREHEDFEGVNILPGYDAVKRVAGVNDDSLGHGTAVTGVIAAAAGNRKGASGVAYGVTVLPVKVAATRTAIYSSDLISGIRFAADAGAKIINLSVGGYSSSYAEQEAVNYALSKGCILVAAAGNEGNRSFAGRKSYPASYEGVISVASVTSEGERSAFSQYNDAVDVAAPGEDILVPVWENGASGYKRDSGTSYSCAFVSGIAALALSGPAKAVRYGGGEFLAAIAGTCGGVRSDETGYGVINAPKILQRSALPLITGVSDGGFYSEKVSVGFNFGEAKLDGVSILDGETVTANGKHTVTVTWGEHTVRASFRIDRDLLSCEYREYADRSYFEFTRGWALLDGFPYASGTPITASGRHRFVLTDGDETVERTVDTGFAFPEVTGVEDGGVYHSPVGIKIVGGGGALLDGAPAGSEIAVTDAGDHVLTVFSLDRRRTREYAFTLEEMPSHRVYRGDLTYPGAAIDEKYGYIVLYNDSLVGARVCLLGSPDKTEYVIDAGKIYSHAFESEFLLLFGENGVTFVERASAASAADHIADTVAVDTEITAITPCGGTLFCFGGEKLYSLDYFSGQTEELAETGFECTFALSDGSRICALPYEGSTKVYLIDPLTYESSVFETGSPVYSESLLFSEGLIISANRVYDSAEGKLLREFDGAGAAAYREGLIFSDTRIYDLETGAVAGIYPEPLFRAWFGEKINLLFFEDGRIDVIDAPDGSIYSLGAAPYADLELTAPERADSYRSTLFYGGERRVISASAGSTRVFFLFGDSAALYSFESGSLVYRAAQDLRYSPRAVNVSNGRVCVCFRDVPAVWCAPENDLAAGEYVFLPAVCTEAFYDGRRVAAVCGEKIYYCDPAEGTFDESGISALRAVPAGNGFAVLAEDGLSLYSADGTLAAHTAADASPALFGGEYVVCGANVYASGGLKLLYTLDSAAVYAGNGLAVTRSGVYALADGKYIGDTLSAVCEVCASTGDSIYTFGGGLITACGWGDGALLSGGSFIEFAEEPGQFTESATPVTPRGVIYVDGREIPQNTAVTAPGEHVFVHPMPCGECVAVSITVVSRLTGIEFSDSERDMNIGEQITLHLNYLPEGAGSYPAVFRAEPQGVTVDGSGVVSAEKVGSYRVTAEVDAGYGVFYAECTVSVRDDLIVFPAESGLKTDRNLRMLRGVAPGLEPGDLLSLLPEGRNAAILSASGEPAVYPVRTGDRVVLLREDGSESDSLTVIVGGDTDCDGFITAHDLYICERILTGFGYGEYAAAAADISGDGINTNADYSWLRNMLTGYFPGEKGTPPENIFGSVTAFACSQAEPGGILDVVVGIVGCKYTRAFSGRIFRTGGLEFVSCESLGWECGAYDDGVSTGIFAYAPDGESGMRPFIAPVHLRYRVTAEAGETVSFTCEQGFSVSFESGSRTVRFTDSLVSVAEPPKGEFNIEILNAKGFSFNGSPSMFAVIPYDAALADLRITRPEGSVVSAEGAAVPLSDSGVMHISVSYPDGRTDYYTVNLRREPAPGFDYNCRLSRLEVEGFRLDPEFDPDRTEYTVSVPFGTEKINVYCVQQNKTAAVAVSDTAITGDTTVVTVTVASPDGEELVYTLTVHRLPPEESEPPAESAQESSHSPGGTGSGDLTFIVIAAACAAALGGITAFVLFRRKNKGK